MATTVFVDYYNSFWLKKVVYRGTLDTSVSPVQPWPYPATVGGEDPYRGGYGSTFPGLPWRGAGDGYPEFPSGAADSENYNYQEVENWVVEEARIRGGFNGVSLDYGAKAYLKEDSNAQEIRPNALIYSALPSAIMRTLPLAFCSRPHAAITNASFTAKHQISSAPAAFNSSACSIKPGRC